VVIDGLEHTEARRVLVTWWLVLYCLSMLA
jgi:hypothetical protein